MHTATRTKGLKCSRNLLNRDIDFMFILISVFFLLLMFRVKFKQGGGVVSLITVHTVFSGYSLLREVADFCHKPKAHSCGRDHNLSLKSDRPVGLYIRTGVRVAGFRVDVSDKTSCLCLDDAKP